MSDSTATLVHDLPPLRKNRRELIAWGAAAIAFIGLALFATPYFRRPEVNEKQMRFVVAMPDKVSEIAFPIISPEGNSIAFLGTSEGRRLLFVRDINSLIAKPLNGTEDSSFPFWSPDGGQLAFFSHGKIRKIDINGGTPQELCDAPNVGGGTWNRDGVILFGVDNKPLQRVSASAGGVSSTAIPLDQSRKETAHFWPHFLPDGNHFLYQSWTGRAEDSAIYVASLDGKDRKLLIKTDSNAAYADPGYLLYARATTLLAQPFNLRTLELSGEPVTVADQVTFTENFSLSNFSVSNSGVLLFWGGTVLSRQLIWFDRNGKQLSLVGTPGQYNDVVLSPDEKRLAVQQIDGESSDLWIFDLARGLPSRFTFETTSEDDPVWSPDGNTLVFSISSGGPFDLYKRLSTATGKDELLSKTPESKEGTDWSQDGRFILMDGYDEQGGLDLWVLPLFGDGKPYTLLNSRFQEGQGHFSPDGKWFAYVSNESGRNEVYVRRFPQCDNQVQISTDGGAQPHWRKDGRELFYIANDRKLMAVDLTLGISPQVGTPKPLFATRIMRYEAPNRYVVSGDGQKFLVNSAVEDSNPTPITVVLNWTAGLKK